MQIGVTGTGANGVMLLGEAWGQAEKARALPFQGPAGAQLAKMLHLAGLDRDDFLVTNCYWDQPPQNREPTDAEIEAHRAKWESLIVQSSIKVIVPLGNVPLRAVLGLTGIQGKRGYHYWWDRYNVWIVPTVHPSFVLRGNANWSSVWVRDVCRAVETAASGPPPAPARHLSLDPSPAQATEWVREWEFRGQPALAFDIETPDKSDDEEEADLALGQLKGEIYRIGFAYRWGGQTYALSVPFGAGYTELVSLLLHCAPTAVVWNRHFDVPRLRAHGVVVKGALHDAQEMWHVLQSDLFKGLEKVAPILIPGQPYWKDQSRQRPAFYNSVDSAVTIEAFEVLYV